MRHVLTAIGFAGIFGAIVLANSNVNPAVGLALTMVATGLIWIGTSEQRQEE